MRIPTSITHAQILAEDGIKEDIRMSETFKVRIIKAKNKDWWYSDRIGEVFKVENHPKYKEDYRRLPPYSASLIDKTDCEIVGMEEKEPISEETKDIYSQVYEEEDPPEEGPIIKNYLTCPTCGRKVKGLNSTFCPMCGSRL